jgi:Kef-type K+ transport system membrane component KefB
VLELPALPLHEPAAAFAVLLAVVLLAPHLAERLRVPGIVGLILAGTLIGPTGLGLLERDGAVALLGGAGLLYLMFLAGLELDLDELAGQRRDSLLFGAATFVVPMGLGVPAMLALGFPLLPAILLALCWASHTLLTYPLFRRYGVASNRAVATSVGATILTDTAALLVLAVVARAAGGALDTWFWGSVAVALGVVLVSCLVVLPRLARWVFATIGQDRTARVTFTLLAAFAAAAVAELVGLEGIIGAFLAGLALNRLVPADSLLMARVEVIGATILIPLFLVSVGMLIDPALLSQPRTLGLAAAFTGVATLGKWLAAEGTGRVLGYDPSERTAMFALSNAQAAATLAAVFVGLEVGLLGLDTVNAVVGVVLVTCLVASWAAARSAPRLPAAPRQRALGQVVVVPIARPASARPLATLAAALARRDGGLVVPVTVVPETAPAAVIARARSVSVDAEAVALAAGVEARAVTRVDADAVTGILRATTEHDGTLLLLGWIGPDPGAVTVADAVVERARCATVLARLSERGGGAAWPRVVVAVDAEDLGAGGLPGMRLGLAVAAGLSRDTGARMVVLAERDDEVLRAALAAVGERDARVVIDDRRRAVALAALLADRDLLVVPAAPDDRALHGPVARLACALPDVDLLVAVDHVPATAGAGLSRR